MTSPESMLIGDTLVRGLLVDDRTRCEHYHGPLDVIALRFACCREWYPCHECHTAVADHPASQWSIEERREAAVLCGECGTRLRIDDYLDIERCPSCRAGFNPGCRLHHRLYFD
ncbi:CHY zinc finger protein [Microbacterium sp. NPDC089696]|uniref:CHY zinc finger protein n=1 Tax=Microbacterium sp. NPDC089696 TaxID=3364199 RepID=UPI003800FA39